MAAEGICWGVALGADCGDGGAVCCEVVFDAGSCTDASALTLQASSYDQSCAADTDCVGVSEGNSCNPCDFSCANAAISAAAMAKYTSDTESLPAVLAVAAGACPSSCGGPEGPCCRAGTCQRGPQCFSVGAGDAATEAGPDAGDAGGD